MAKCDGLFVSLKNQKNKLIVRDVERKVITVLPTRLKFSFYVYADMVDQETFYAYDNSLDFNFKKRYEIMLSMFDGDSKIRVIKATFTTNPLKHLFSVPAIGAPTDGVVLVSVFDETPHYKWKAVQTADFLVTANGRCLAGWQRKHPPPHSWCVFPDNDDSYFGLEFGDSDGPHTFLGDLTEAADRIVECRFQPPRYWIPVKTRHDKTKQYKNSKIFCGANSWTTIQSVLDLQV